MLEADESGAFQFLGFTTYWKNFSIQYINSVSQMYQCMAMEFTFRWWLSDDSGLLFILKD